jgi:hypothetical protein
MHAGNCGRRHDVMINEFRDHRVSSYFPSSPTDGASRLPWIAACNEKNSKSVNNLNISRRS